MSNFILSCCSTVDLTKERLDARQIPYICFHFTLDNEEYLDDFGASLAPTELYQRMLAGSSAKTSQISIGEYYIYFKSLLEKQQPVLHLTLSSGISGSYHSACMAAEKIHQENPDAKLYIVDSLSGSAGYGMIMETLADMRDAGQSIEEVHTWIESNKKRMQHWFFSNDLTFFIRGGRISKTAGLMGQILHICPMMVLSNEGKIEVVDKIRTRKKAIKAIADKMVHQAVDGIYYSDRCYITHSDEETALMVRDHLKNLFPHLKELSVFPLGTTIGCHTGPGAIALFFWGNERPV